MGKIFTRKELERLNVSEENIELVLKCQKTLPILFDNNGIAEFSVSAIDLWNQIGSKDKFANWVKSNIFLSDNVEENDYKIFYCKVSKWEQNSRTHLIDIENIDENEAVGLNQPQLSARGIVKTCMLKLDVAKDIVMYIGALPRTNKVTKEISKMYRQYFRVMEKIVKENKEWYEIRDPEKYQYKLMCDEIERWVQYKYSKTPSRSDYACEADMLNEIVVGMPAKQIRAKYNIPFNELTRDYLKKEHNEELLFLEEQNIILLKMNLGFTERETMLYRMYNAKYGTNRVKVA